MNLANFSSSPDQVSALVSAACEGSSSAFGQLQTLYSRHLYRTIMRITKNKEDAEDVLQDTFMCAFLSLRSFERRSSFYSWLTRIGINSALMLLRKRRARSEVSFDLPYADDDQPRQLELKDSGPDPEQIYNLRQICSQTLQAIQRLHPSLRTPIFLQVAHEYSLKDIAKELEMTQTAVKARLHRGRASLSKRCRRDRGELGRLSSQTPI